MPSRLNEHFAGLAKAVAEKRDRRAFEELFDHFAPRLKSYLLRLNLEASQAEELTQDVMIVLWHKAALFDPEKSSLATWLFRVARNRRIDALRRDRSSLIDPDDPFLRPPAPDAPDDALDASTRDARVRAALALLPAEQVKLLRMAFFLGLSHSQIAAETGLPLGTVKSRIRLAFGRLRTALERDPRVETDRCD